MRKLYNLLLVACATILCLPTFSQILEEKNYIRVDQLGYLPTGSKLAVIAKAETGFNSGYGITLDVTKKVELRKVSDNTIVFDALATTWNSGNTDSYSGDKGWWFNFSSYTTAGEYYIRAYKSSGSVDSYPFKISQDVYANALKAAMNMFYYQRCNINKTAAYASGSNWTDGAWYAGADQDASATLLNGTARKNLSRGWIDAGDPNKYINFVGEVIHDLLTTYEHHTTMWNSFNLNIPESNNSIPDILDEVKWEIDWVSNMVDSTSGGIHTKMGILQDDAYISPPSSDARRRYYDKVCPSSSIIGAGQLAHAALHFKNFPDLVDYSNKIKTQAERAWTYYINAPDKTITCDEGEIEAGDADGFGNQYSVEHKAEAACAAVYLFALTGNETYHTFFKNNYTELRPWKADDWGVYRSNQSEAALFYTTLTNADNTVKTAIINKKSESAKSTGTYYQNIEGDNLYRAKTFYSNWGSNSLVSRQGADNMDFIEYNILSNNHTQYRDKAQAIVNYIHGVNPFGVCYLTNMYMYGAEYCTDELWHTWFKPGTIYDGKTNGNVGPAPGFLSGGHNKAWTTEAKVKVGTNTFNVRAMDQPTQKAWTSDNETAVPWAYNEPGTYYNSGYVKMLAHFVTGNADAPIVGTKDTITSITGTASITKGQNGSITVNYSSTSDRDIYAVFQLDSGAFTTYNTVKVDVPAGNNQSISIAIPTGSAPVANDAYQYKVYITTDGGTEANKFDTKISNNVDIVFLDKVYSISGPSVVKRGGSSTVTVLYSSSGNKEITYNFQLDNGTYASYGLTKVNAAAGDSQTVSITVAVGANAPIANDNYQHQVYISPIGGDWNGRLDNKSIIDVDLIPSDKIYSISGPSSITRGGNASVTINYSSSTNRDVIALFQLDNGAYTTFGQVKADVVAGDSQTVTLTLPTGTSTPVAVDAYQIQGLITTDGGTESTKLDSKVIIDVDVNAADKIYSVSGPGSVLKGSSQSVNVLYSASTNRDVYVLFQLDNGAFTTYGQVKVDVVAGDSQTVNVMLPIGATTPIGIDAYQYQAYITADNGTETNKIDSKTQVDVDVTPADKINSITGPTNVNKGANATVTINYSASTSRDIIVYFQLDTGALTIYGQTKVDVVSGDSQSVNITVPTGASTPVAIDAYQFQGIITTDGGNQSNKFDSKILNNIDINPILLDKIISVTAPASIVQGASATLTVNYSASTNRDIIVTFQLDNGAYTSYGSTKVDVVAGDSQFVNIVVATGSTTPIANDNYQFQTILTTDGGDWVTRLTNLAKIDIDVTAPPFVLTNNATYRLKSAAANIYLNSQGSTNGSNVGVATLNTNATSQRWTVENVSGSVYRLKNLNGNKYLNAQGNANGNNVGVADLNTGWDSEKWTLEQISGSTYRLKCSWGAKYLNAQGTANGNNVGVADNNSSSNNQKKVCMHYKINHLQP
jgi:endoglucanase